MKINIYDPNKSGNLSYGFLETPFGRCLVARCTEGICEFFFADDGDKAADEELRSRWRDSIIELNPACLKNYDTKQPLENKNICSAKTVSTETKAQNTYFEWFGGDCELCLRGTPFQLKVWAALTEIPLGSTTTYSEIAERIGKPEAVRAVATAIASNKIAMLIPCHRVIRRDGSISGFRWGIRRKKQMLDWEKLFRE